MLEMILVALIVFSGVFTQTVSGFGMALVAMPLLTTSVGLMVAAPLISLVAMVHRLLMLLHYRSSFDLHEIWRLMLASVVGIAIATVLFRNAGESHAFEVLLGFIIIGYSLLNLINPHFPQLRGVWWAYPFGIASGILSRIYNVGGPPVVMYANGQQWSPAAFKGNLQAFTALSGTLVILSRGLNGEFTGPVVQHFVFSLPATILGVVVGVSLDRYIDPVRFRQIVLALLVLIGLTLIL